MAFKGDDSTLSLATTVTLALAVAAMVLTKNPLQSSRPPGLGTGLQQMTGELSVRARLWEDPFAAVEKAVEAQRPISVHVMADGQKFDMVSAAVAHLSSSNSGLESLKEKIKVVNKRGEEVLALVAMTQGGSSVEDGEARIRDRYAVAAALEVGCFAPDKGESLSYFTWKFPENSGRLAPHYTPYEWYSRNAIGTCSAPSSNKSDHNIDKVLVLWAKAKEDEENILARIDELISKLHPQQPKTNNKSLKSPLQAKLIGPRTSSEFRRILQEIKKGLPIEKNKDDKSALYRWQKRGETLGVYSPWATAPSALLVNGLNDKRGGNACGSYQECVLEFNRLLMVAGLDSLYRVTSDDVLFATLLDELERRRIKIGDEPILLIGEWDSFYARALPFTFLGVVHRKVQNNKNHKCSNVASSLFNERGSGDHSCMSIDEGINRAFLDKITFEQLNIVHYSYLSGLDGEGYDDQTKRANPKEDNREKDKDKREGKRRFRDIDSYERPEGESQLDYVRRLVTRIKEECEDDKVKAIGILGRDPYDALLILQAVREEFPNALFFTTDLDARYFHEDEQKWTRNLIVASQFGLQLEPSLQQSIPPFRSSLQTSTFFAVLQAIGRVRVEPSVEGSKFILSGQPSSREFATDIPPRIFEIGRHGAVDLSPVSKVKELPTIHPVRTDMDISGGFKPPPQLAFLWIVGLTLGFLALWGYGRLWNWMTARDEPDPAKRRLQWIPRSAWVLIPVVMVLVFACQVVHLTTYAEEEPFSWTDGVSIWPTEALRFMALCLSLFFLFKAHADSARNFDELTKSFSLGVPSDPKAGGWREKMEGFWNDLNWMFHGSKQDHPGDVKDLWMRYRRAHGFLPRAARIAMGFVAYLCLLLPMVLIMNGGELRHAVPCRGTFSCGVDVVFLSVSVVSFLILNLALLDAVILCTKWIQEMPGATSRLTSMQKIRLIVERSTVVNRRVLHPFLVLFLLVAARNHYFDNWDFPPGLILALTVNSLVLITSATVLYVAAVGAKRRILAPLQYQLDKTAPSADPTDSADQRASNESIRLLIKEVDGIQQGAFVPFYQQPMVQATLVAALAFLQYWYLGQ